MGKISRGIREIVGEARVRGGAEGGRKLAVRGIERGIEDEKYRKNRLVGWRRKRMDEKRVGRKRR